jgi:hypothetical protein
MSDDRIDSVFTALRERPPEPRFAPADEVRRRGRQRGRHQAAVAGIAVVGVLGGAGLAVAGPFGDARSTAPAASPTPTSSAASTTFQEYDVDRIHALVRDPLFLHGGDLPAGFRVRFEQLGGFGHTGWPVGIRCRPLEPAMYPSRAGEVARRTVVHATSDGGSPDTITQTVLRYDSCGWANMSFTDLDLAVPVCDEQVASIRLTEVDRDVYLIVARFDQYVSTLEIPRTLGQPVARALGVTSADRLGVGSR